MGARYGRKLADIFDVQEEIAKEISERLRLQLTRQEKKRLSGGVETWHGGAIEAWQQLARWATAKLATR